MKSTPVELQQTPDGVLLPIQAQPRARRNAVTGTHGGRLKVAVTDPPEKGKANDAIAKLLAKSLNLKRSQLTLLKGPASSQKTFLVANIGIGELAERVAKCLQFAAPGG